MEFASGKCCDARKLHHDPATTQAQNSEQKMKPEKYLKKDAGLHARNSRHSAPMTATTDSQATADASQNRATEIAFIIRRSEGKIILSPRPPSYCKEHTAELVNFGGGPRRFEKQPARITLNHNQFDVNAIGDAKPYKDKTEALRLSDEDSAALREMEARHAEIARQQTEEKKTFLSNAAARARRVRVSDCHNAPK